MDSTDNKASIALLRRLRAGGDDDVHFVHRIDVCTAPPEVLVADLEPVPGTGLDDDGYSRIWYFYHAKKFKNSRGDTSGHRHRAVTGGGGARWHSENRKDVEGSGGGTFCSLSYGLKTHPSAPLDRFGWCMVEYDLPAADDSSNYVLCKVYRSPRAKGKPASASSSTSSKKKQTAKKRKADGGDHPEAPPAKLIQQQEPQVHQKPVYCYQPEYEQEVAVQQPAGPGGNFSFNFNIGDINCYVDESMLRDEPEPGQPQPAIAEPEHDGRFIQLPCGPVLAAEATVGDMLGPGIAVQRGAEHGGKDLNMEEEFTVDRLLRGEPQQPIVEPPPGQHGGEFIQMPFGPVVPAVAEATLEDMLGLGPEIVYGQWSGGRTTRASIPWSSYYDTPTTSSLHTGCSSLLQGPDHPRLPYLTC